MPAVIQYRFHFLPRLPDGWRYVANPNEFLEAEDAGGKRYLVDGGKAYPKIEAACSVSIDLKNPVVFPDFLPSSTDH